MTSLPSAKRVALSYVITTRNRLPFLTRALDRVLAHLGEDEELIVVDGASDDGTVEYVQALADEGLVAIFISEPDLGEAHGYNKAILRARGELVKLITDDDVFWWPGIAACRAFMLANRDIDLMGAAGAQFSSWSGDGYFHPAAWEPDYLEWVRTGAAFSFSGLGLMLRPSALAATGLFNTGVIWVDAEFTMRCTRAGVRLAWHTGHDWARLGHNASNAAVHAQRLAREADGLALAYDVPRPASSRTTSPPMVLRRTLGAAKRRLGLGTRPGPPPGRGYSEWAELAERAERWLADWNAQHEAIFLTPR